MPKHMAFGVMRPRKVHLIHQDAEFINIEDAINICITAGGPKLGAMVAGFGVGWVNTVGPYKTIHPCQHHLPVLTKYDIRNIFVSNPMHARRI